MAEFILKDWYGKDQVFDKETIYVQGTDGELMPFTHGDGNPVIEPLNVTRNGVYTTPVGVNGFGPVSVNVPAPEIKLQEKTIAENGEYTADAGFDGLAKVLVKVAGSSGSADVRYVTFMSYDGLIEYGKKAVAVGDDCADPIARGIFDTPTRESDPQYSYTFYGWATTPGGAAVSDWNKAITENKTVYANFVSAVRYYTITYYDDDGITVLKTETLTYGSMPSYTPEKDEFNFDGWNPNFAVVTADASYTAKWSEIVNIYTWENVLKSVASGNYKNVYAVGDLVPLNLGSEGLINMQIAAFDTDILADGSGNAPITWIANELLSTSHRMNPQKSGSTEGTGANGGWEKCEMRTYLHETIKPLIPGKVRSAIKTVKKAHFNTTGVNQTTNDDVWILSKHEIVSSYSLPTDGVRYTIYTQDETKLIKSKTGATSASVWWCRNNSNTGSFEVIRANGSTSFSDSPQNENGVVLCFCT